MAVDVKKLKVGDVVSEIEFHLDLKDRMDCIHKVTEIELFPHGNYHRIGLSGYAGDDDNFSEFNVYLPHPAADVEGYLKDNCSVITGLGTTNCINGVALNNSLLVNNDGALTWSAGEDVSGIYIGGADYFGSCVSDINVQSVGDVTIKNQQNSWTIYDCEKINLEWAPKADITPYELALCTPFIILGLIDVSDTRQHSRYFRHFELKSVK